MAVFAETSAPTNPMAPHFGVVRSMVDELADTFTITVEAPGDGFHFEPGQFTMLYAFGVGEVPISISGDPADHSSLVQTIRVVGAVTDAIHHLAPGDHIGIRGPFGRPWPLEQARGSELVIVGGGIGLAPLRPVVYAALRDRETFERVIILYGARSPSEILFAEELEEWGGRFDLDVMVTVDTGDSSWRGAVGVVTELVHRGPFDPDNSTVLMCGPEMMMRYTALALQKRGVALESVYASLERNMKCGVGICGHCQFGPHFVCWEGPVFCYSDVARLLGIKEV